MVVGNDIKVLKDVPKNPDDEKERKIKCGNMLFDFHALIKKYFIEIMYNLDSPKDVIETKDALDKEE
jgi:hypothetical protein